MKRNLLIPLLLIAAAAHGQEQPIPIVVPDPLPTIQAPDETSIGRLVVLTAPSGTEHKWLTVPDGQQFLFEEWPTKPVGFCDMAWQAIHTGLMLCWFGADLDSITIPGKWQACCPDGLRPVVFLIEPIESDRAALGSEGEKEGE